MKYHYPKAMLMPVEYFDNTESINEIYGLRSKNVSKVTKDQEVAGLITSLNIRKSSLEQIDTYPLIEQPTFEENPFGVESTIVINNDNTFPSTSLAEYPFKFSKKMSNLKIGSYSEIFKNRQSILKISVINEIKSYIDERIKTYFTSIAYESINEGIYDLQISENGEILVPYSKDILSQIPVDPFDHGEFLLKLHNELYDLFSSTLYERKWGMIKVYDNSIFMKLKKSL